MEYKDALFDTSTFNAKGRTITGYAAVFGDLDSQGDMIASNAFAQTLQKRRQRIRLLWQHDRDEPIGRITALQEDSHGLCVEAVISQTKRGLDVLALLADGAIDGLSIGYRIARADVAKHTTPGGGIMQVRTLREIELYEISLVTFPANDKAAVTSLKSKGQNGTQWRDTMNALIKIAEIETVLLDAENGDRDANLDILGQQIDAAQRALDKAQRTARW